LLFVIFKINKPRNEKTVTFLVDKNVDALTVQNNNGWYPIHIAAYRNLPIHIIYYMAKKALVTIIPLTNEQIHLYRKKNLSTLNDNINYISRHYS